MSARARMFLGTQVLWYLFDLISIVYFIEGDYGIDQIYPNYNSCPYLSDIEDNAYASDEFTTYNDSQEVTDLTETMSGILGDQFR